MKVLNIIHKSYRKQRNKSREERNAKRYFKKAKSVFNLNKTYDFEFTDVEIDFELEYAKIGKTNSKEQVYGADNVKRNIRSIVEEGKYDIVVFYYKQDYKKIKGFRFRKDKMFPFTYNKNLYLGTSMIQIVSGREKSLVHELMHAIGKKIGSPIVFERQTDYMDTTPVKIGNKVLWKKYYHNKQPYRLGGNFHKTFLLYENTKPVKVDIVKPVNVGNNLDYIKTLSREQVIQELKKHFKITELVPKVIATKHGEGAWRVFDTNLLRNILFIRRDTGRAMTVNGRGMQYRGYDNSGYRPNTSISYHVLGKAIDFDLRGWNAGQSRQYIRDNYKRFPYPQGAIEVLHNGKEITWCHYDIRDDGFNRLLEFNV